jgi:uncharacterized heparinase superfamily protein
MIIDCGPVGPDYQPGHSHCDTLSFELSLGRHRVVVDSRCCQYEDGEIRKHNRCNAGHNTDENGLGVFASADLAEKRRSAVPGVPSGPCRPATGFNPE